MGKYVWMIIGIAIMCFISGMISHEMAHFQIYREYGFSPELELAFPTIVTVIDGYCPNEQCTMAHLINDSIAYGTISIFCLVFVGLVFLMCKLEDIESKLNKNSELAEEEKR